MIDPARGIRMECLVLRVWACAHVSIPESGEGDPERQIRLHTAGFSGGMPDGWVA